MRIFSVENPSKHTSHLTDPCSIHLMTWPFWRIPHFGCGCLWGVCAQGDVNLDEGVMSHNMDAVAFIPKEDMLTQKVNDIASWYDAQEDMTYLLVGCENGTALFRMLPGARPIFMGKVPTHTVSSLWRDIKVVHDHAYIVSEAPAHGMQVMHLEALRAWSPLDGPVVWTPDTVVSVPGMAHNVVAFEEASKVIQVGTSTMGGGAAIFDVSEPSSGIGGGSANGSIHDAHALIYNGPDAAMWAKRFCLPRAGRALDFGHHRPE